jgi:16S rRNA (cytidine1402-2'-O)-methyltransferase
MTGTVYLIPIVIDEAALHTIPLYIMEAVKSCTVIFAENERTARRFLKAMDKAIVIDNYKWHTIHKAEQEQVNNFTAALKAGKNIAIISEAGCPGIADPGQVLIAAAQELNAVVKPLVGPSAILLALMASGMNGQQFEFIGYLPVDTAERIKKIKELELSSAKNNSTKIFIETPYRNDQLIDAILKTCKGSTQFCIAADLTGANEFVKTKTVAQWQQQKTGFHKKPVIFLLQA